MLNDVSSSEWALGVTGTMGVEWLVNRNLSVMAEYATPISYRTSRFNGDSRRPETDRTVWSLSNDNVRFGLSVYW